MNTLLGLEAYCALFALSCMVCPFLTYYCIFRLNISKLQNIIFMVVSYAIYFLLQYLPYKFNSSLVYLAVSVMDAVYALFIIKNIVEHESVLAEFFSLLVINRLISTIYAYSCALILPEKASIFWSFKYEKGSVSVFDMACFLLLYIILTVLYWLPARFLKRMLDKLFSYIRHIGLDYMITVITVVTCGIVAVSMRKNHLGNFDYITPLLACIIAVSFIVLIYLYIKRLTYKLELKQLQNKCALTEK
ncbi:MAG: hypothetical protein NC393_08615, partial [Clostridium sp.]|nr:hypothetical protein [Clostridium sp.]